MFARTTLLFIKAEKVDEGIAIYETSVIPAAQKQKGFQRAVLLVDRKAGKGISITFWDTEADAIANEENLYYQDQLVKFIQLFSAPPIREGYEVAIDSR